MAAGTEARGVKITEDSPPLEPWKNRGYLKKDGFDPYMLMPATAIPLSMLRGPVFLMPGEKRPYLLTDAMIIEEAKRTGQLRDIGDESDTVPRAIFPDGDDLAGPQLFLALQRMCVESLLR